MSIKFKILVMAICSVLASTTLMFIVNMIQLNDMSKQNIETIENKFFEKKKAELKQYTDLAYSSAQSILNSDLTLEAKRQMASTHFAALRYGDDGYFFGYTDDGVVTTHAKKNLLGKNLLNSKSENDVFFIQDLIKAAKNGGDYVFYEWPKLGQDGKFYKLSYAIWLPELKWMLGTGFYTDDIENLVFQLETEQGKQVSEMIVFTIAAAFVMVVILAGSSVLVANSIIRPLDDVSIKLQEIAQNDGDLTLRLLGHQSKEINALSSGFNSFVEKVHLLVKSASETVLLVDSSSKEVETSAESVLSSVDSQKAQVHMVATAMNEMATSAQEVASKASEAARCASLANSSCETAKNIMVINIQAVDTLVSELDSSSNIIDQLRNDVSEIVTVLEVIRGIAEQTNLLALNAAIEAARAGEQGRGFAVVADEVRTLASRTQKSTQEIQGIIETLKQVSEKAVLAMNASKLAGESTRVQSVNAGEALNEVTESVEEINEMNAVIESASREQTLVSESINQNLQSISNEAEVANIATKKAHNTASLLTTQSGDLTSLIDQFKV